MKKQHFSIRKYSVGAASVLIGASLFLGGQVRAEEQVIVETSRQEQVVAEETTPPHDTVEEGSGVADSLVSSETSSPMEEAVSEEKSLEAPVATSVAIPPLSETEVTEKTETAQLDNPAEAPLFRTARQHSTSEQNPSTPSPLPAQGQYTYTKRTEVKNQPKATAPVQFYAEAGSRVFYDQVLQADGQVWISYTSYSGVRRYTAVAAASPRAEQPLPSAPTGKVSIYNQSPEGFHVRISEVASPNGVAAVKVPVWSDRAGQDDIVWYDGVKQANGDYEVAVHTKRHKEERGDYHVHLYYVDPSGKTVGVAATKTTIPEPQQTERLSLPSRGEYQFTKEVQVKLEPRLAAKTDFTFIKGEKIYYDQVVEADNHQWLSYVSYSGLRRYVQLGRLTTETVRTGDLSIASYPSGDFDVHVRNVADSAGLVSVKIPVWSDRGGQDDLVWYDGVKQANGDYKASVKLNRHKNERGTYHVHLYYVESTGQTVGITGTTTTVAAPTIIRTGELSITSQPSGDFDVHVRNVADSAGLVSVKIPVWSDRGGQDDLVWYDGVKQANGDYKASVKLNRHKNERGTYHVHLYYVESTGQTVGITGTTTTVAAPQAAVTSGKISIENNSVNGFDVRITEVTSDKEIASVKVPVWSDRGGQDDVIWYDAVAQADGAYKVRVAPQHHHYDAGKYHVHLYYLQTDGKMKGVGATTTQLDIEKNLPVSGRIRIENQTETGFDVRIHDVLARKGVEAVKVPVWSDKSGQDDLVWYDALRQVDGSYKVSVPLRNHRYDSGRYHVHLYYLQKDGQIQVVTGITLEVAAKQPTVSFNGSYHSLQGKYGEVLVVNKQYAVAAHYNPGEHAEAKAAFTRLRNDMIAQGYNVGYGYSGFRSYQTQSKLYSQYVARDGQAAADRYSARPGHSEHQTGLAYDLTDKAGNLLEDRAASQWLRSHAHQYGFVVRYLPDKEAVTGFMAEPWHIRYVGQEATDIYQSGLTLEEYYGFAGGNY